MNSNDKHTSKSITDNYLICNNCNLKVKRKQALISHIKRCEKRSLQKLSNKITKCEQELLNEYTCKWCNLNFKNFGNLASHALRMHRDPSYMHNKRETLKFQCNVCRITYRHQLLLKYHIRKAHFNLISRLPYCELQKVNQVWFEKVLNTNIIVEMRKTDHNTLVIKKLDANLNVQVQDTYRKEIDLRSIYPIGKTKDRVICHLCKKMYSKHNFKKHMNEKHGKIAKHVRKKIWQINRVKEKNDNPKVLNVES